MPLDAYSSLETYSKNGGEPFTIFSCVGDARAHLRALQVEAAEWGGKPTIWRRTLRFGDARVTVWCTSVR